LTEDYKIVLEKDGKCYVASVDWVANKVFAKLENQLSDIQETLSVLRNALHEEVVCYFQERILRELETSGKAWRYGNLVSAIGPQPFWREKHEALEKFEKNGKVVINRGWIKLPQKEDF